MNLLVETSPAQPTAKRRPRRWIVTLIILGVIASYGAAMLSHGYGWSPLLFILFGAVVTPVLATLAVGRSFGLRAWLLRLAVLILIGAICYCAACLSRRIDPHEAFTMALKIQVPSGVRDLRARKQWYDGQNIAVTFTADASVMAAIRNGRKYSEPRPVYLDNPSKLSEAERRLQISSTFAPFFDRDWLFTKPMTAPVISIYADQSARDGLSPTAVHLVWDEATGQGVACAWFD